MRMSRPLPYPKKINPEEKLYYHYKIDAATYALYDSEMDTPIAYGAYNFIGGVISYALAGDVTIFYYEVNNQLGWKMKACRRPNNTLVETADVKKTVERSEEKKKDLT